MNKKTGYVVIVSMMIVMLLAFLYGWHLRDKNECQYWSDIKTDYRFHPTELMTEQCDTLGINIR